MSDFTDGHIYVDHSQMSNASEELNAQTNAIRTILSELEMQIQGLMNSWIGDDKDIYAQKQEIWNKAVDAMAHLLTQHSRLLESVSENYKASGNVLAERWGSVKIGR
ncbi:WXG100 family type VII secretion target [Streptomyces sp. NPDC046862]|uniref:WXG100 family type VII secretion target n=1 Tax=Streptomyces sp. NPDC046862 TaxID=3154603 RepID=UPI00345298F2